ncbi:MAG: hypothetical protein ACREX8_12285 [Gammaproteobacteria bacterium]
MWTAVTVCVISLLAMALMIESAVAVGFTGLVVPIIVAEFVFLAAVYVLWRAFSDEEDAPENRPRWR